MEYNDLPAFETPDGVPATSALAPPIPQAAPVIEDDADDLLVDGPDDGDDEPGDDDSEANLDDEGRESPKDEVAALRARLKEAEAREAQLVEYEQQMERVRHENQQREAEAYWDNSLAQANQYFLQREEAIYAEAERAVDPAAYIAQQMRGLNAQRVQWLNQFHALREQQVWQFAMQQALPNYAAELADYYGLGRDSVPELLTYPPDLIPREAERMKRDRDRQAAERRKATQAAKKAKNQQLAAGNTTPGDGRAMPAEIELGSDEHYNAIPWQRV